MFQLENAIHNWKDKLYQSNTLTHSDIEELETHLIDEVSALKDKGLSEEEAFYVASNRIGSVDLLSCEFAKVNFNTLWMKRIVWLLSGYIIISFAQKLISVFTTYITILFCGYNPVYSKGITQMNFILNLVLSVIVIFLLLHPVTAVLSKLQGLISYLVRARLPVFIPLFTVFVVIYAFGYQLVTAFSVRAVDAEIYGQAIMGREIYSILWSVLVCVLFLVLAVRQLKLEHVSN
jgi:hypothetical protein